VKYPLPIFLIKENIMSYMMFLYQGLTILGKKVDEVTFPEAESSKERWIEKPRALQPVENKEGKSAFALVELIGNPKFVKVPKDCIWYITEDRDLIATHIRATTGLTLASTIPGDNRRN
jgi:hypothetical protein